MVPCEQGERIMKIETNVKRLVSIIDGNGNPGLYKSVIQMKEAQIVQRETVDKLMHTVIALRDVNIRTDAEDKLITRLTHEKKVYGRWLIGIIVVAVLSIAGFVISVST